MWTQTKAVAKHPVTWVTIAIMTIGSYEGLYLKPYRDVVGVKTVCYGETAADHVDLNRTYTKEECSALLAKSVLRYDAPLEKCIPSLAGMPPHRHAAVVSLGFNIGTAGVCRSSVARAFNRGDVRGACNAFLSYDHAGGRRIKGLTTRRKAERADCLRED